MNIQNAYEDVRKFNLIAGNLKKCHSVNDVINVRNQIEFINEELNETVAGVLKKDAVDLLDGACDLFVTVAGLLQKLEVNGFDVDSALKRVNANNLSKFPFFADFKANPNICPKDAVWIGAPFDRVVFKRSADGKVLKPTTFKAVDIIDCVPEDFFGDVEEF